MSNKQRTSKRIGRLLLLIYVAFLLSILITNGLSKFKTAYGNSTNLEIAKPIANLVAENELSIKDLHNEEVEWNFNVNNYTDSEINQVLLSYKIKIDKGNLTDLQYKLYKIENGNKQELVLENDITSEEFLLSNTNIQIDEYCLVVKTTNNIDQKGLDENVNVSIIATQIM